MYAQSHPTFKDQSKFSACQFLLWGTKDPIFMYITIMRCNQKDRKQRLEGSYDTIPPFFLLSIDDSFRGIFLAKQPAVSVATVKIFAFI